MHSNPGTTALSEGRGRLTRARGAGGTPGRGRQIVRDDASDEGLLLFGPGQRSSFEHPRRGGGAECSAAQGPLRYEPECLYVPWPQAAEVPMIECRSSWLVEALDNREHRGVDKPDIGIGIAIAQLANSPVVVGDQSFHAVGAGNDVVKEGNEYADMQARVDPVVDFDEDRCGNDQRLLRRLDEPAAGWMVRIASIKRGVEGPGIQDQRHGRGAGRSSAVRRAVSV